MGGFVVGFFVGGCSSCCFVSIFCLLGFFIVGFLLFIGLFAVVCLLFFVYLFVFFAKHLNTFFVFY